MPWNENDYPASMKNLSTATRKKAIDMANAMVDDGYDENRAIPIAMEQAKKWRKNASAKEVANYKKHGDPEKRSEKGKKYPSNPERLEEGEQVVPHEDGWAVKSSGAERPTAIYDKKTDAMNRAKEIAKNKGTQVSIYKQDGTIQQKHSYE